MATQQDETNSDLFHQDECENFNHAQKMPENQQNIVFEYLEQLSVITSGKEIKEARRSEQKYNTNICFAEQFGAFGDDEYPQPQNCNMEVDNMSTQPTAREILTATTLIKLQFPHLAPQMLINILYQKMIQGHLLMIYDQNQDLSEPSICRDDGKQDKYEFVKKNTKEIDLVSIKSCKGKNILSKRQRQKIKKLGSPPQRLKEQLQKQEITRVLRSNDPSIFSRQKQRQKQKRMRDIQVIVPFLQKSIDSIKLFAVKASNFHTNQEKSRFIEKRMVAKAFIRKGYGLNNLRKEISDTPYNYKFDQSRYKTISYGVATDTFRKLQTFLQQYCLNYVYKMEKMEMKPLYSIILNCRDNFPDDSDTFIKFMQAMFNVDCEYIFIGRKEAMKLYETILTHYKIKEGDTRFYQPRHKKQKERIIRNDDIKDEDWTSQKDCELLQFYRDERNISKVRERYRQVYGPGTIFQDCKFIKSKLYKALRQSIRKIKSAAIDNREYSQYAAFLNSLNNERIKKILISPDAADSRVFLCDFYLAKSISLPLMQRTSSILQDTIVKMQRRRGQLTDEFDEYQF